MTAKSAIVVGAGIAGLTAGWRLKQAGYAVQVLEAAERVGGRMITIAWEGIRIDPGAEFVTGADRYLHEMAAQLGVRDRLVNFSEEQTGFFVHIMRGGKVHSVNFMSIPSYLRWSGVSLAARLSMIKLLPYLLRYGRVNPYQPEQAPGDDRLDMQQFFYQCINAEMFDYWVEPTMDVMCSYRPADLSGQMLLILFGNYLQQKLYTFEGGLGLLPETLAGQLDVIRNAAVHSIEPLEDGSGARVVYRREGDERTADAHVVVVAVPGDLVLPLFTAPRPAWQAFFRHVRYTTSAKVYFIAEGDERELDHGAIMFPSKEPWQIAPLGWDRQEDGRIFGMSALRADVYDPALSDAEILARVNADIARCQPTLARRITHQMVFRWPRKVPTFPAGYLSALRAFKRDMQEGPIYFCGDYLIGPSAGSALASGWQCAARILGEPATRP